MYCAPPKKFTSHFFSISAAFQRLYELLLTCWSSPTPLRDGLMEKRKNKKPLLLIVNNITASCLPLFSGQTLWTRHSEGHSVQDKRGNGTLWSHQSEEKSGRKGRNIFFSLTFKIQALMLSRWGKKMKLFTLSSKTLHTLAHSWRAFFKDVPLRSLQPNSASAKKKYMKPCHHFTNQSPWSCWNYAC